MRALPLRKFILSDLLEPLSRLLLRQPPILISLVFSRKLLNRHLMIIHGFELLCVLDVLVEGDLATFVVIPHDLLVFFLDGVFEFLELALVALELHLLVGGCEQGDDLGGVAAYVTRHLIFMVLELNQYIKRATFGVVGVKGQGKGEEWGG